MPYISDSSYRPPRWLKGRQHLQTIIPSVFRKIKNINAFGQRLELPDGDFLDLDWINASGNKNQKADKLVILSHGLEGSSGRPYITGMAKLFNQHGYDALAWNMRGCSGQPNRLPEFYHHGSSKDLKEIIKFTLQNTHYQHIVLIGFSLGGNVTLKYLGEENTNLPPQIKRAVAFSVPCHLPSSVPLLRQKGFNQYYSDRFKNKLIEKIKLKKHILGEDFVARLLPKIKTLDDLTDLFFANINGFETAEDYYYLNSSGNFLSNITIPTLIVNAANDPMLSPECSDIALAQQSKFVYLEVPAEGGHCGFMNKNKGQFYWSEHRALAFCEDTQAQT